MIKSESSRFKVSHNTVDSSRGRLRAVRVSSEMLFVVIYPSLAYASAMLDALCLIMSSLVLSLLRLLGRDLRVLLDGDLVVGLEGGDEVVGELGAVVSVSIACEEGLLRHT